MARARFSIKKAFGHAALHATCFFWQDKAPEVNRFVVSLLRLPIWICINQDSVRFRLGGTRLCILLVLKNLKCFEWLLFLLGCRKRNIVCITARPENTMAFTRLHVRQRLVPVNDKPLLDSYSPGFLVNWYYPHHVLPSAQQLLRDRRRHQYPAEEKSFKYAASGAVAQVAGTPHTGGMD